jgi:hypothetical protein
MIVTWDERTSKPHRLFRTEGALRQYFEDKEGISQHYSVLVFISGRYAGKVSLNDYLTNEDD